MKRLNYNLPLSTSTCSSATHQRLRCDCEDIWPHPSRATPRICSQPRRRSRSSGTRRSCTSGSRFPSCVVDSRRNAHVGTRWFQAAKPRHRVSSVAQGAVLCGYRWWRVDSPLSSSPRNHAFPTNHTLFTDYVYQLESCSSVVNTTGTIHCFIFMFKTSCGRKYGPHVYIQRFLLFYQSYKSKFLLYLRQCHFIYPFI